MMMFSDRHDVRRRVLLPDDVPLFGSLYVIDGLPGEDVLLYQLVQRLSHLFRERLFIELLEQDLLLFAVVAQVRVRPHEIHGIVDEVGIHPAVLAYPVDLVRSSA